MKTSFSPHIKKKIIIYLLPLYNRNPQYPSVLITILGTCWASPDQPRPPSAPRCCFRCSFTCHTWGLTDGRTGGRAQVMSATRPPHLNWDPLAMLLRSRERNERLCGVLYICYVGSFQSITGGTVMLVSVVLWCGVLWCDVVWCVVLVTPLYRWEKMKDKENINKGECF